MWCGLGSDVSVSAASVHSSPWGGSRAELTAANTAARTQDGKALVWLSPGDVARAYQSQQSAR